MTVVLGIDVGGTKTNATVLDDHGVFLVDRMVEVPSRVTDGPTAALAAIVELVPIVLDAAGVPGATVLAVGLDTPGPSSADGVISSKGSTNFAQPAWWGFDVRAAVEETLQLPVIYNNDGNAASLYAHQRHFGHESARRSSVSAIVGTGLGGGVIEMGAVVRGASGMAGELGHVHIPLHDVLEPGQPIPRCNCGFVGDLESVASLSGIVNNLLPYWLTRYPDHPLADRSLATAAKEVRSFAQRGDEMALRIFEQQAKAVAAMFTIAANVTDPDAYFLGGGVVDADSAFRDWFLSLVQQHTLLRDEQRSIAEFVVVADLDMAGARGSAIAALNAIRP